MSLESDTVEKELSHTEKIVATTPKKATNDQETTSYLGRIYWAFIDKKKLKFQHQFPRMRESEIINKIIREWQALTMEEKLKLGETYNLKQEQDSDDNLSDLPLDSRSEEHKISDQNPHTRAKQIKQEKNLLEKDFIGANPFDMIKLNIQDSESQINHQEIKDQEASQDSSNQKQTPKSHAKKQIGHKPKKHIKKINKPIKKPEDLIKLKNGDYILFYKHYYSRLKAQHPKWSSIQINHIVKLLWKKRQQQNQKIKKQNIKNQKLASKNPSKKAQLKRPISGKEYFTREKKKLLLRKEQIDFLWKKLPRESKNDWNKRGAMLGLSFDQKEDALQTNMKNESSLKTEKDSSKKKMVISFKDALLKGGIQKEQTQPDSLKLILQEKEENWRKQAIKKQIRVQKSQVKQKGQNFEQQIPENHFTSEYISLAANPFSFMKNKISVEKIILE